MWLDEATKDKSQTMNVQLTQDIEANGKATTDLQLVQVLCHGFNQLGVKNISEKK